jgi:hypothetical protein
MALNLAVWLFAAQAGCADLAECGLAELLGVNQNFFVASKCDVGSGLRFVRFNSRQRVLDLFAKFQKFWPLVCQSRADW